MANAKTRIKLTPPGGTQVEIQAFADCTTSLSSTDRAGSFSLALPVFDDSLTDKFPVGTDVQIEQDGNKFRGFALRPPKELEGTQRVIRLEGATYAVKTQKITVTEIYKDAQASTVVNALFAAYAPQFTRTGIENDDTIISLTLNDVFLWDAMEDICERTGHEWNIDENLTVNYFERDAKLNDTELSQAEGNYRKGTASFERDAEGLVNRLTVRAGETFSAQYKEENFYYTGGETMLPLDREPVTSPPIIVLVDGSEKTVGILGETRTGTRDFLINAAEKTLIMDKYSLPAGVEAQSIKVRYRYKYPIKFILEDKVSQAEYGVWDDVLDLETTSVTEARLLGLNHLNKYKQPIELGSIEPFGGVYYPGETVKVDIPDLLVDGYYRIRDVSITSEPGTGVVIKTLKLETPERELAQIIKDITKRLRALEQGKTGDSKESAHKIIRLETQVATLPAYPRCRDDTLCADTTICGIDPVLYLLRPSGEPSPSHWITYDGIAATFIIRNDDEIIIYFNVESNETEDAKSWTRYIMLNGSGNIYTDKPQFNQQPSMSVTIEWRVYK